MKKRQAGRVLTIEHVGCVRGKPPHQGDGVFSPIQPHDHPVPHLRAQLLDRPFDSKYDPHVSPYVTIGGGLDRVGWGNIGFRRILQA